MMLIDDDANDNSDDDDDDYECRCDAGDDNDQKKQR